MKGKIVCIKLPQFIGAVLRFVLGKFVIKKD